MSDIFISYSREDRDRILPLVSALEKTGWSVFWDKKIPVGKSWRHVIDSEVQGSRSVIVVWTEKSITSKTVHEEAEAGKRKRILIPVLLDNVEPPLGFRSFQTANLAAWNGDDSSPIFIRLVEDVATILGPVPEALNEAEERPEAQEERLHEQKPQRSEGVSKIFISYRRDDSSGYAQAIYRGLILRFSKDRVFMDVDTVEPGVDFVRAIEEAVSECDVLLALIGKRWANVGSSGTSRLDDPNDFVRLEISTALARDIRVIPVLVDGMTMPRETLPTPLKALTRRNAMEISHTRFEYDVERVVTAVRLALGEGERAPEGETGLLKPLRKQMLVSLSPLELRALLYELEAYLAKYPHSPEARLLKDKMQAAMRRAEETESTLGASAPAEYRAPAPSPLRWLLVLGTLGVILYALLLMFGYF